jgi:hypothetical protein
MEHIPPASLAGDSASTATDISPRSYGKTINVARVCVGEVHRPNLVPLKNLSPSDHRKELQALTIMSLTTRKDP